jgi:LuxR family transcriptional regulator, maltose regulon positive regulatory protein
MTFASVNPLLVPTKLAPPRLHTRLIRRERLLDQLGVAPASRLTLVIAPAGFGKSTLVAQWLVAQQAIGNAPNADAAGQQTSAIFSPEQPSAAAPPRCAWLTLDEYDREPLPFLAYLAAAIERVTPGALPYTVPLLRAAEAPAPAIVLQALLVDLDALQEPLILVLDDYHFVTAEAIHHSLAYLVRHLPEACRLVLLSRVDPPLPLVRMRAEHQVTELRAADLRFTAAEALELLTTLHGVAPDPAYLADLYRQTEGWAITLQLAAVAQHGGLARGATQTVKHQIAEYLAEEVFARQPADVQAALLAFAVPERFCAELGMELLDPPADQFQAELMLEQMLQANLLIVPLDGDGNWYRFYPLFRDLLLRRLQLAYAPERVQALQRRAANWLEAAGFYTEAVRLYLAAGAGAAAGALIEGILYRDLGRDIANASPAYWLGLLPDDLIGQRPGLALIKARIAAFQMDVSGALVSIDQTTTLRAALEQNGAPLPWPTFDGDLAVVRGTVMYYAHHAPAEVIEELWRGLRSGAVPSLAATALAFLARAYAASGRYTEGVRLLTDLPLATPDITVHMAPLVRHTALCMVHELVGRIDDLAREAQQFTAALAATHPKGTWALFAAAFRGRAAYEQSKLAAAAADFALVRSRKYETNAHTYIGCLIGLGQIALAQGALTDADEYAQEVWAFANEMGGGFLRNEALGFTVRLALVQGDIAAALSAAEQISVATYLGARAWYAIAPPQLSRAAAFIAAGDAASLMYADEIIAAVIAAVEPVHNMRPLIAAQVMRSLLLQVRGRHTDALALLERVVEQAAALGLVRTILDCGAELQALLVALVERGAAPAHLERLLAEYRTAPMVVERTAIGTIDPALPEMLTRREVEILGLLAERLADKEIAEKLVIAPNTVRKHTSTIYSKLGVNSRREAVEVARSLGLLRGEG